MKLKYSLIYVHTIHYEFTLHPQSSGSKTDGSSRPVLPRYMSTKKRVGRQVQQIEMGIRI